MPDRISYYRQARLSLYLPPEGSDQARYALLFVGTKAGVPNGHIHSDGVVRFDPTPGLEQAALLGLDAALAQVLIR